MLLQARELTCDFGAVRALDGASVEVDGGEAVALLGANGAGKSTLLRVLAGLVRARGGDVLLDGERVDGLDTAARVRRGISMVPEGGGVLPRLSVEDNLRVGASGADDVDERRDEVLHRLPLLAALRRRTAGALSGGEQRQVAVGRALMARPRVLLVDELSLGLSPLAIGTLIDVLVRVRTTGTAVLLVEQRAEQALRLATRGYVLERGRVILAGASEDLLADPAALRRAYLGSAAAGRAPAVAHPAGPGGVDVERVALLLDNPVRRGLQELADAAGVGVGVYASRVLGEHVAARRDVVAGDAR